MTLKREIKDAYLEGGNSIYVKTHSNAVYVDDNETETLTQRIEDVTTQLDTIEKEKNIYKDYDFVKKYKAKCDGITDDTQALQNMINDSEDGVYIKLPPTTIRLNGSIVINNKSVTIEGSYNCNGGTSGTKILCNEQVLTPLFTFSNDGTHNPKMTSFSIKDLEIYGSKSNSTLSSVNRLCIDVINKTNEFLIDNIRITGFKQGALRLYRSFDGKIDGLNCLWCGSEDYSAIRLSGDETEYTNNVRFFSLHLEECKRLFSIFNCHDIRFTNCKFEKGYETVFTQNPVIINKSQKISFTDCIFLCRGVEALLNEKTFNDVESIPYYFHIENYSRKIYFNSCEFNTTTEKGYKWINCSSNTVNYVNISDSFLECNTRDYPIILGGFCKIVNSSLQMRFNDINITPSVLLNKKLGIKLISGNNIINSNIFTYPEQLSDNQPSNLEFYVCETTAGANNLITDNNTMGLQYTNLLKCHNNEAYSLNTCVDNSNDLINYTTNVLNLQITGKKTIIASDGTTITNLAYGKIGQTITIHSLGNVTIKQSDGNSWGRISLKDGTDKTLNNGQTIKLFQVNSYSLKEI